MVFTLTDLKTAFYAVFDFTSVICAVIVALALFCTPGVLAAAALPALAFHECTSKTGELCSDAGMSGGSKNKTISSNLSCCIQITYSLF